jgi:hypothetical protein
MVSDFLFPESATCVGQCTLFRIATDSKGECTCELPDGYDEIAACRKPTPFGEHDFVPKLLDLRRTGRGDGTASAIALALVACEVVQRESPVIFWWKDIRSCEQAGHLGVASGLEATPKGAFVLVLDPWPWGTGGGERTWYSWKGFTCGRFGYGHCTDYFDIRGDQAVPSCPGSIPLEEAVSCGGPVPEAERIASRGHVTEYLGDLLRTESGRRMLGALDLPESVTAFSCDPGLRLREAVPGRASPGARPIRPARRSRLLCRLEAGEQTRPLSALVFETETGGSFLAGFGSGAWTEWVDARARQLAERVPADEQGRSGAPGEIELLELFLPGAGEAILIDPRRPQAPSIRYGDAGFLERPFDLRLDEKLDGPDGPTLREWVEEWTRVSDEAGP